jgi:excisionase family DNA binding protein
MLTELDRIKLKDELLQLVAESVSSVASIRATKEWLTMKEACEVANCSRQKLSQLIESGEITASKSGVKGATVSVSRSSINKYFERNTYKPQYEYKSLRRG